jgi:hypothetical protein
VMAVGHRCRGAIVLNYYITTHSLYYNSMKLNRSTARSDERIGLKRGLLFIYIPLVFSQPTGRNSQSTLVLIAPRMSTDSPDITLGTNLSNDSQKTARQYFRFVIVLSGGTTNE